MPSLSTGSHDYMQVNMVADTAGFSATRVDTNLRNPWGISIGKTGTFWISCNHTARTVIYNTEGSEIFAPVAIPFHADHYGGSPTGAIFNETTDFVVSGKSAKFIYATENGTIAAWATGDSTVTAADRSSQSAIYKGLAIANDSSGNYLFAADFFNARIDVFDKSFNLVTGRLFADTSIPAGFAPFNIHIINGLVYVAYAKQKAPDKHDDLGGPGNGYINIFTTTGKLIKRFVSGGALNSPWGIIQPPVAFGQGSGRILVANFGDGRINVFDSTGTIIGPLENNGIPIVINGLWDIAFHPSSEIRLYFTAGPEDEKHGLFGYLQLK